MTKYRDCLLAKNSTALQLFQDWKKSGDNKDRKKLDDHMKAVENKYNESTR